ncbi:MAG: GEVED domain-containing protein, partial [Planctomycetes bacterium]|nr:GEVED domain-containing protein [Planctomycetota bacterium]
MAADSQGRAYVVGDFRDEVDFNPEGQGDVLTSKGQSDIFLTRLAGDGSYLGTLQFGDPALDLATDVSVDGADNIALTGMFMGSVDFDPTSGQDTHESKGDYDGFVTRLSSTGNYLGTWTFGGEDDEEVTSLIHDGDGNVYVTGGYEGTVAFGPQEEYTSQGGFDIFVTRLNADGTYGWTRAMGGQGTDFGRGLAAGPPDDLFVVGSFAGSAKFDLGGSGDEYTASGPSDLFVTRLNRDDAAYRGTWTAGGTGLDQAYDVVAADAVEIVGFFQNSVDFDHTENTDLRFSLGNADAFLSRFLEPGEAGGEIGNRVWHDVNADGQFDAGEPGLANVPVRLYRSDGAGGGGLTLVSSTVSDADGFYGFSAVTPGDYVLEFETPAGYALTLADWGSDDMWDSDAGWADGRTVVFTLTAGESQLNWDAGFLSDAVSVIGGRAWDDVDGDGLRDPGEGNVAAVDVTLMFDAFTTLGTTITAADGRYAFTRMNPGEYYMHFTPPGGYSFTKQDAGSDDTLDSDVDPIARTIDAVVVTVGTRDLTWDAGILRRDYGDAPDPTYPTLATNDGAVHRIVPGQYLGMGVEGDADGQPDSQALGDDTGDGSDDEDGIVFTSAIVPGSEATVEVIASWEGRLDAWIDFGRDGSWAETDDRIFSHESLSAGTNELTFAVPSSAVLGESYARFRYSKSGVDSYTGYATDGEVEDCEVVIEALDWGDTPDLPDVPLMMPLSAPDVEDWQKFGVSTSTHGDWVFVGADFDGEGPYPLGAAYVYRRSGSDWVYHQKLTPSDTHDVYRFGASVSVWGNWAAIGTSSFVGLDCPGAVFLFEWDGTNWVEREKLTAADAGSDGVFGGSVSLNDHLLIAGAPRAELDSLPKGAAYVFRFDGTTWTREAKLTAADAGAEDSFGSEVAGRGDWAIVGASREDTSGEDAGAAYVFHWDGVAWTQHQKIIGSEVAAADRFAGGQSIAFDGFRLLIGAPHPDWDPAAPGAVYVFEYDGSDWLETYRLTSPATGVGDQFGDAVALWGDLALIGASGLEEGVFLMRWDGSAWETVETVGSPAGDAAGDFGSAVSLFANRAVVGDASENRLGLPEAGGAYVYHFPMNPTHYPTLFVNNGARHSYDPGLYLGAGVDWEGNGLASSLADGDDLNHSDDEDGVTFSAIVQGGTATAEVTAS